MKRLATGVKSRELEADAAGIMDCNIPTHRTTTSAFTLRELLVVIVILTVLGTGLLATLHQRASWQIKKVQCAANLKQFALTTQLYAAENRDSLPSLSGSGWAWDLPTTVSGAFLQLGMDKRTFYCPGTAPRFNDELNFLNAYSLWNWSSGFSIIGYATTFRGLAISMTNYNRSILAERPEGTSNPNLPLPANSERVLMADATISENAISNPSFAGSFTSVLGGFGVPHISPHLNGNLPVGGNLAFKDGHVAWRKFSEMSQRATSGRGFWW